ncbi:MAG TPA: hypothetical protein VNV82_23725 [Bryobacteraceae bacterium]|jgi:hypothetical protein|nr:hypothetical protein [Bryobacteraceae bacterium]
MLTALAPSGPVAQSVPASPPSTTGSTQSGRRESFKDVYQSVPSEDQSQSDAAPKQKATASTVTKSKKTSDGNDKVDVTATPMPNLMVVQKNPLTFSIPSIPLPGHEVESLPVSDEAPSPAENQSQSFMQSGANDASSAAPPGLNLPLPKAGPVAPLAIAPADEKLAFSARLTQPESPPAPVQATRISTLPPSRSQTSEQTRTAAEPTAAAPSGKDPYPTADSKKTNAPETVLPVREISPASVLDLRQPASPPQHAESTPAAPARSLAIQDIQPALPEMPKPPASTEIMLQLAGQNQSTASVRVVDRMGTINVTVHAADADLRSSLRSNLSDLASQLTGQGYKTEMVKPAVLAANADNQHDSRQSGRDASGHQHQFTPDGRPNQRDRRANPDRWRDQLDLETSGTPGAPGGKS